MAPATKLDREVDCYRDAIDVLHDKLTDETLYEWMSGRRSVGTSWRDIRDELRDRTNIKLSDVALIRWYGEFEEMRAAAVAS